MNTHKTSEEELHDQLKNVQKRLNVKEWENFEMKKHIDILRTKIDVLRSRLSGLSGGYITDKQVQALKDAVNVLGGDY